MHKIKKSFFIASLIIPESNVSMLKSPEFIISFVILFYFILIQIIGPKDRRLEDKLRILPEELLSDYEQRLDELNNTDRYAYVQYATQANYLNLAIYNFVTLRKAETRIPHLVVLYDMKIHEDPSFNDLKRIAVEYNITFQPVEPLARSVGPKKTWFDSYTKFHIFNLVEFDKVVYFDADSMLVNVELSLGEGEISNFENVKLLPRNLDELFMITDEFNISLPMAYWLQDTTATVKSQKPSKMQYEKDRAKESTNAAIKLKYHVFNLLPTLLSEEDKFDSKRTFFGAHVIAFRPSREVYDDLVSYLHHPWYNLFKERIKDSDYDMDILNIYLDRQLKTRKSNIKVGILPHRQYGVLTGEFREKWHAKFLTDPQFLPYLSQESNVGWNAKEVIKSLRLVHFSDYPIPKPWEKDSDDSYKTLKLFCIHDSEDPYFDTVYWEPKFTHDCTSAYFWEWIREQHKISGDSIWY